MPRSRRNRNFTDDDWDSVAQAYREMRKQRRRSRLYRDPDQGILGGVCAGLANYLGIEPWIVRLVVIALMIFGGILVVVAIYAILWIVLDPTPNDDLGWLGSGDIDVELRSNTVRTSPKLGLRVAREDLRELDLRLRRLETYVTSKEYDLDRSFKEMG